MDRKIVVGGFYRHFKGFLTHVLYIARHTETGEKLVIYACTGGHSNDMDGIYARPLEMFLSEVDRGKYPDVKQKYRFEYIQPN